MRSVLLFLLLAWAGVHTSSPVEVAAAPENAHVHTGDGRDDTVLVAEETSATPSLVSEARRWQPSCTDHAFASPAVEIPGQQVIVCETSDRRRDHAYQLFTLARPHAPRAPPARS